MNACERAPMRTVALRERILHTGGTVGDRGARPGRIPAAARARGVPGPPGPILGPTIQVKSTIAG